MRGFKAGQEVITRSYGRAVITSIPYKAKTSLNIKVTQRGRGWNEATQQYERYKDTTRLNADGTRTLRWGFTHRDEYGHEEKIHINEIIDDTK